jgi:hypothetical protein
LLFFESEPESWLAMLPVLRENYLNSVEKIFEQLAQILRAPQSTSVIVAMGPFGNADNPAFLRQDTIKCETGLSLASRIKQEIRGYIVTTR